MSIGRISQIQQETRMKMMYHLLSNEKKDEIQKQNQQTRRWFQTVKPPDLSGMYTKIKPEMSEEERSAKFFDIYNTAFKAAQKELRK